MSADLQRASSAEATRPLVSEREAVLRERDAAFLFYRTTLVGGVLCPGDIAISAVERASVLAFIAKHYPLPKVSRPRVVADPHGHIADWRVIGATRLEFKIYPGGDAWHPMLGFDAPGMERRGTRFEITPARAKMWADLFANPTETVDDDGSAGGAL